MDNKFTEQIQKWLDASPQERSLSEGAELLLKLNRNRWMYQQILRRRLYSKLEYELRKHANIRRHGYSVDSASVFEKATMSAVKARIVAVSDAKFKGFRPDHENLPEDIKAIPEENARLFHRLKELFESLKNREDEQPCDRHEDVYQLAQLDAEIRKNWERYDRYSASGDTTDGETEVASLAAPTAAQVSAARKYLSSNASKLRSFVEAGEDDKSAALRSKMQERVDLILRAGESFKAEFQAELEKLGLNF